MSYIAILIKQKRQLSRPAELPTLYFLKAACFCRVKNESCSQKQLT
ncbi:hypothetical protein [Pectinatus frisingensis]